MATTDVFFGFKIECGEDPLYEKFPKNHFRKVPMFQIGQNVINTPNGLSSVVNGIEKEAKPLFDAKGVGAYILRVKKGLRFTESLPAMDILDSQIKITSCKFKKTPNYAGFEFDRKGAKMKTSTIKEYRSKEMAIFPPEKTITPVLNTVFAQPNGTMEYAEHVDLSGKVVSYAQSLDLTNFSNVLGDLDEILKKMNNELDESADEIQMIQGNRTRTTLLPGIRTPYFYIGRSFTQFPFHQEDFGLGSVAICFYADKDSYKLWIVFAPEDEEAFNKVCAKVYPNSFNANATCDNPVHQKNFFFDVRPFVENKDFRFKPLLIIQRPGDIVVTRPGAIHGGTNVGFTVNSSVNFAFSDFVYDHIAYVERVNIRRVKNGKILKVPRDKWARCCLNENCTYHNRGHDFSTLLVNNLDSTLKSDKKPRKKLYEKLYASALSFEKKASSNKCRKDKRAGKEGVYHPRRVDPNFQKKAPKALSVSQRQIKNAKRMEACRHLHGQTKLMIDNNE